MFRSKEYAGKTFKLIKYTLDGNCKSRTQAHTCSRTIAIELENDRRDIVLIELMDNKTLERWLAVTIIFRWRLERKEVVGLVKWRQVHSGYVQSQCVTRRAGQVVTTVDNCHCRCIFESSFIIWKKCEWAHTSHCAFTHRHPHIQFMHFPTIALHASRRNSSDY